MNHLQIHIENYTITAERDEDSSHFEKYYAVNYNIVDSRGEDQGSWEVFLSGPLTLNDIRDMLAQAKDIDKMFICLDCEVNTGSINEYYMVTDAVWAEAHPDNKGMLCIGCLEERLGRMLTADDFPDYPVNMIFNKSERLTDRLQATH